MMWEYARGSGGHGKIWMCIGQRGEPVKLSRKLPPNPRSSKQQTRPVNLTKRPPPLLPLNQPAHLGAVLQLSPILENIVNIAY